MNINSVLLVEDDEITNFLSTDVLNQLGVKKVDAVTNGQLALDYLLLQMCPDLIFLDLNMPVMDGLEFLRVLNHNKICPDTKIVVLTTSSLKADKQQANLFEKVIAYLEKPLTIEKVKPVLDYFFKPE